MIDLRERKRAMVGLMDMLWDESMQKLNADFLSTLVRVRFDTVLGDFSALPDEVEDNSVGRMLVEVMDKQLGFWQRFVAAKEEALVASHELSEKFKRGEIDADGVADKTVGLFADFTAQLLELDPAEVRSEFNVKE